MLARTFPHERDGMIAAVAAVKAVASARMEALLNIVRSVESRTTSNLVTSVDEDTGVWSE